ncbi:MAG: MerR family transcriptional regulator [Candidatus Eremiobacteraeota bacterium]|nr:MerR family transcriptional regulator [Candidatus Eremiobacteraeota bacterium]
MLYFVWDLYNFMGPGRYKIKTIAELSGFTPTLLRAWERRYDLLEPERQPSGHRLYTESDLRVLLRVRELMERGRSIGEIAVLGREALLSTSNNGKSAEAPLEPTSSEEPPEGPAQALADAAARLDASGLEQCLNRILGELSREQVLYEVLLEAAQEVGRRWSTGELSVAAEHLFSGVVATRLREWIRALPEPPEGSPCICAGFPDEQHEMGLLMVCYELRKAGRPVLYLGPCLPLEDLERAVGRAHPRTVFLSVSREAVFEVHHFRLLELVARNPETRFVLGGAGVARRGAALAAAGVTHWPGERPLAELAAI